VRCKGASILRIEVVRKNILEIVVAGWICTELGVVLRWSDIDWCSCARFRCLAYRSGLREERGPLTALPSPHKTRSKQLTALIGRYANIEGVLLQEGIEFRNKLEEIAERKKATVQSPGWPGYRGLGSDIDIAFAADEDHSLTYYLLTWFGFISKPATAGWEIPSRKPKLQLDVSGQEFGDESRNTDCS